MTGSQWLSIVVGAVSALICYAYAASLIIGFEMSEPKALLYLAGAGYWVRGMMEAIKEK